MKDNFPIYPVLLAVLLLSILLNCKKETIKTAPTVTVSAATNITATTATSGGQVTADGGATVTASGVCWSINQNPTTADNKTSSGSATGSFTSSLTDLTPGTIYNLKAYAINSVGTGYSSQSTFTTLAFAPVLTTTDLSSITATTATSGGNITNDGGAPVTARGVCWSTNQNPTITESKTSNSTGSGSFTSSITGLTPGATYYFRAYATNSVETAYGNQVIATTTAVVPTLSTVMASSITATTATSGGNITNDGGATVTVRGVCWSTNQNPTIADSKTSNGTGSGSFTSSITGLTPGTIYYIRAHATNSAGTGYGNQNSFTSTSSIPSVTTKDLTGVLETSAIAGVDVLYDGGSSVSERGICYSKNPNPTIADSKIKSGTGTGSFTNSLNTLMPNTTYNVRAYAINAYGIVYGENKSFTTLDAYYAGFENGMPSGWTGMWSVSTDEPYEGYYCLKSEIDGDSIQFTRTIINPEGGQFSFFYKENYVSSGFYIDNVLQTTSRNESEGWHVHTFAITPGTHSFKWRNNRSGYTYIDYIICTK